MNLGDMTRDQLWALDMQETRELYVKYIGGEPILTYDVMLNFLEQLRLELQQDAADARRDTQQER